MYRQGWRWEQCLYLEFLEAHVDNGILGFSHLLETIFLSWKDSRNLPGLEN